MARELGEAMISDIMVREAWQRNCGPRQVRSGAAVLRQRPRQGEQQQSWEGPVPSPRCPCGTGSGNPSPAVTKVHGCSSPLYKMVQSLHVT